MKLTLLMNTKLFLMYTVVTVSVSLQGLSCQQCLLKTSESDKPLGLSELSLKDMVALTLLSLFKKSTLLSVFLVIS